MTQLRCSGVLLNCTQAITVITSSPSFNNWNTSVSRVTPSYDWFHKKNFEDYPIKGLKHGKKKQQPETKVINTNTMTI